MEQFSHYRDWLRFIRGVYENKGGGEALPIDA